MAQESARYHPGAGRGDVMPGADQSCSMATPTSTARAHMDSPAQAPGTWGWLGDGRARTVSLAGSSGSRWCHRQGSTDPSPRGPGARAMVWLPTSTHGLPGDREAARERAPTPSVSLKHRCPQSCVGASTCGPHTPRVHQSRACLHPIAATSWLSSLPASSIRGRIFGRALSHWHRSHLAAT